MGSPKILFEIDDDESTSAIAVGDVTGNVVGDLVGDITGNVVGDIFGSGNAGRGT